MPICPSGHDSDSADYCDVCGLQIDAGRASGAAAAGPAPAAASGPSPASAPSPSSPSPSSAPSPASGDRASGPAAGPPGEGEVCPEPGCGTPRSGRFCEGCGYDYATGTPGFGPVSLDFGPPAAPPQVPPAAPAPPPPSLAVPYGAAPGGYGPPPSGYAAPPPPAYGTAPAAGHPVAPPGAGYGPGPQGVSGAARPAAGPYPGWHVVVSADRRYYDSVIAQGGPDAARVVFPPYCPERVFPLAGGQVRIGRRSRSRGIHPEIDLSGPPEDPGISHLHAVLVAQPDGSWTLIDPGSANGTKINDATDPIATNVPVPVADGDRVYIGAWTVLVLRKA